MMETSLNGEGMVKEMKPMLMLRACGHPKDAVLYAINSDETVDLYCLPCIMKKIGAHPCETVSVKTFVEDYMGGKLR